MRWIDINWFVLVTIPVSLWLGLTGRIDWWIIIFVWLMHISINMKWEW